MPLSQGIETGITFSRVIPELVSELEEREAAKALLWTWTEWSNLPRDERVDALAHYRLTRLIAAHENDALESERRRRELLTRRANQGGGPF